MDSFSSERSKTVFCEVERVDYIVSQDAHTVLTKRPTTDDKATRNNECHVHHGDDEDDGDERYGYR